MTGAGTSNGVSATAMVGEVGSSFLPAYDPSSVPAPTPAGLDRLAELAIELAVRVRTGDPDENAVWLAENTTELDRWRLLFVQAAVGPDTAERFARARGWVAAEIIDEVAVERACAGERIVLNRLERAAAVRRLTRQGCSQKEIVRRLGTYQRFVTRVRADDRARDAA